MLYHAVNGNRTANTAKNDGRARLTKFERAQIVADVHAGRASLDDVANTKQKLCAFADVSIAYVNVVAHRDKPAKPVSDAWIDACIRRGGADRFLARIDVMTAPPSFAVAAE
ncbi:hypothetical protein CWO89_21645 [Bradyrhizobium sp. Leo170]|nr:hypothetical protein CWO89_21645 [Bradyrhizobium sp. Leo170]